MKNNHEINQAVIRYIARCVIEGNFFELGEMGIGPDECTAITNISLSSLLELEHRMDAHILNVKLNKPLFAQLINRIRREEQAAQVRVLLYTADAPADLMAVLYGIGPKEYTRQRRLLRLPSAAGRPPEVDAAEMEHLHQLFSGFESAMAPEQWLALAEETGHSLRVLWRAYRQCGPDEPGEPAPAHRVQAAALSARV